MMYEQLDEEAALRSRLYEMSAMAEAMFEPVGWLPDLSPFATPFSFDHDEYIARIRKIRTTLSQLEVLAGEAQRILESFNRR